MKKSEMCRQVKRLLTKEGNNKFICVALETNFGWDYAPIVIEIQERILARIEPYSSYLTYLMHTNRIENQDAYNAEYVYTRRQAFVDELIKTFEEEGD